MFLTLTATKPASNSAHVASQGMSSESNEANFWDTGTFLTRGR